MTTASKKSTSSPPPNTEQDIPDHHLVRPQFATSQQSLLDTVVKRHTICMYLSPETSAMHPPEPGELPVKSIIIHRQTSAAPVLTSHVPSRQGDGSAARTRHLRYRWRGTEGRPTVLLSYRQLSEQRQICPVALKAIAPSLPHGFGTCLPAILGAGLSNYRMEVQKQSAQDERMIFWYLRSDNCLPALRPRRPSMSRME